MTDHSVFKLSQPGTFCDPLTEVLRTGARALLAQAAENSWRRLDGNNQLPKVIRGVKFIDGVEAVSQNHQAAA